MATSPHPPSPLQLPEEGLKGRVELKFFDGFNRGVACKLDSIGYKAMVEAFTQVDASSPHFTGWQSDHDCYGVTHR